jgi:hypothetical protein
MTSPKQRQPRSASASKHRRTRVRRLRMAKLMRAIGTFWVGTWGYIITKFKYLLKWILNNFLVVTICGITMFASIATIVPGNHNFEGNIIASELSFVYNGKQPKVLIENIAGIRSLKNQGRQVLTFTGKFESKSLPKLSQLKSLAIQLPSSQSSWTISPSDPKKDSELRLGSLRIQPDTQLIALNYDFYSQLLFFDLRPTKNSPSTLNIRLGTQPIKVNIENYQIPSLNLPSQTDDGKPLEFIVTPDNSEFNLAIASSTKFDISLAKAPQFDKVQWFKSDIHTKDVKFVRIDRSGDIRDDVAVSTIVEGKIRMVEQEREIKANQFLLGEDKNRSLGEDKNRSLGEDKNRSLDINIQRIRHLQIAPKKGIEARFSGRAKQINIGLDPDFPVSKIQGSWLEGFLPRDVILAIFSFAAAVVASLLTVMFSNSAKSQSKP